MEFSYATFLQVEFYYKYFSCLLQSLLKLLRYQQAYVIYDKMEKISSDWCTNMFGPARSAYLLVIGSMVYLA